MYFLEGLADNEKLRVFELVLFIVALDLGFDFVLDLGIVLCVVVKESAWQMILQEELEGERVLSGVQVVSLPNVQHYFVSIEHIFALVVYVGGPCSEQKHTNFIFINKNVQPFLFSFTGIRALGGNAESGGNWDNRKSDKGEGDNKRKSSEKWSGLITILLGIIF